jgi:phosphoglycerol transferase MdoB-like AlkP superfamily enzyme
MFNGNEADYMNSLVYSDKALGQFMKDVRKQKWFKNTLFIFVSDHGHCTEDVQSPSFSEFFKIPVLFWGEPLKKEFRNKVNSKIGAQCDLVQTLLYQMKIPVKSEYPWSKDILNPHSPEFAFHTIMKGYGWKSPNGCYTKQMEGNIVIQDSLPPQFKSLELEKCHSLFDQVYKYYKKL